MKRLAGLLLLFTSPVLLLSGCWNQVELEKLAHVVVIGLDKGEKPNFLDITFQIANPQVASTQRAETQTEPPSDIITITATDITAAKELANVIASRKMNFAHLQTMIIGSELAKTSLLHRMLASSAGDPEMRREVNLIVSQESAKQFIHANRPKLETRPHKYYTFMQERWKDTAEVPFASINRYFERLDSELFLAVYATTERNAILKEDEGQYIAGQVPQKAGDPVQMIGSAVLKKGKMIGTLTGEETRLSLLLREKQQSTSLIASFPDPLDEDFRVTVRLQVFQRSEVEVDVKADPPIVHVKVPLKVQVLSIPSLTDYTLNKENVRKLKEEIKTSLQEKAQELIVRTQKEFKSEPFLWHLAARKKFLTFPDYLKYKWEEKYTEAKVNVEFEVEIESFGKQFAPPTFRD